jgi:hypothetical protein
LKSGARPYAERRSKGTTIAKPSADKAVRGELHAFKLETVAEGPRW